MVFAHQFGDVDDELIGDSVRVIRLSKEVKDEIYRQNTNQLVNWDVFYGSYNHAIVNLYDGDSKSDDEAEQEIVRAFIIVRIIQPFSSGLHIVVNADGPMESPRFNAQNRVGIGTNTYICASDVGQFVTREHIRKARIMWPQIQIVCQQFQSHRRILRAMRFFEIACSNFDGGIRHILFHSGLETLLCTHKEYLHQQLRQRVQAICGETVTNKDIRDITNMRGSLAHSGAIAEEAKGREEELIQKLERLLRATLYHALSDAESVAIFSDDEKLRNALPVQVKKARRVEIDELIYV
jgi:hypothetical protein